MGIRFWEMDKNIQNCMNNFVNDCVCVCVYIYIYIHTQSKIKMFKNDE